MRGGDDHVLQAIQQRRADVELDVAHRELGPTAPEVGQQQRLRRLRQGEPRQRHVPHAQDRQVIDGPPAAPRRLGDEPGGAPPSTSHARAPFPTTTHCFRSSMTMHPHHDADLPVDPVATTTSAGKIEHVAGFGELRIDKDLWTALCDLLGREPQRAEPVVVLAAYLHSLRDSLGLSEHFDRDTDDRTAVAPPAGAAELVSEALGLAVDQFSIERLADTLYAVFATIADDPAALKRLNRRATITPEGLLTIGQVGWNIEHSDDRRPRMPIRSNQALGDGTTRAHIKAPDRDADYAAMDWTTRTNAGVSGLGPGRAARSSGQGLRTKVAVLAALAAEHLIRMAAPTRIDRTNATIAMEGDRRVIRWATEQNQIPKPSVTARQSSSNRILIGVFDEVGERYQPRRIDKQLQAVWNGSGDRRVWLRGGPGMGKSYTARHVMEESLRDTSEDRDTLLIWVDSADASSATREFALAAASLPSVSGLGASLGGADEALQARALLRHLATTENPWLIVLDNADADDLIDAKLIPPGTNGRGRVIMTTTSASERTASHGSCIDVEEFTAEEGDAYLLARIPESSSADRARLIESLGAQPLALSIAASTIAVNHMTIPDWLDEFSGSTLDDVADHPDAGGYPTLISGAWRIALERASRGLPDGEIERAALIAALHDPAGHPTWIWQRDEILTWLNGDDARTLPTARMPHAVRRLIDHSILRFTGPSWQEGSVSIHQLAARAIRETIGRETLETAANLMANAWLLRLSEPPMIVDYTDVARHMRVLRDSSPEPQPLTQFLLARTEERHTSGALSRALNVTLRKKYGHYFLEGGVVGKFQLASLLNSYTEGATDPDSLRFAKDLLLEIVDADETTIALKAQCLSVLADIEERLLNRASAREHQARGASLNEHLLSAGDEDGGSEALRLASAIDLTRYRLSTGDRAGAIAVAREAARMVTMSASDQESEWDMVRAELYNYLLQCGLLDEAEQLWDAGGGGRRLDGIDKDDPSHKELLFARSRALNLAFRHEWAAAEDLLSRIGKGRLLLASIQAHQGDGGQSRAAVTIAEGSSNVSPDTSDEPPSSSGPDDDELDSDQLDDLCRMITEDALSSALRKSLRWRIDDLPVMTATLSFLNACADPLDRSEQRSRAWLLICIGQKTKDADSHQARNQVESGIAIYEMLHALDSRDETVVEGMVFAHSLMCDLDLTQESKRHHLEAAVGLLGGLPAPSPQLVRILLNDFWEYSSALEGPGKRVAGVLMAERLVAVARKADGTTGALGTVGLALQSLLRCLLILKPKKWPKHLRRSFGDLAMEHLEQIENAETSLLDDNFEARQVPGVMYLTAQKLGKQVSKERQLEYVQRWLEIGRRLEARDPTSPFAQYWLSVALFCEARAEDDNDSPGSETMLLERLVNRMDVPARLDPSEYGGFYLGLLSGFAQSLRRDDRAQEAEMIEARAQDYRTEHPDLDASSE